VGEYDKDAIINGGADSTSTATSVSGKYSGKIVSVTDKLINAKNGKFKLTLEY